MYAIDWLGPFELRKGGQALPLAVRKGQALLMLLAFLVDQIQQRCSSLFRQVWRGLKTKAKLWDSLRSLFRVLVFDSMAALFRHLASLYRLQLE